jgi:hypothetical protein
MQCLLLLLLLLLLPLLLLLLLLSGNHPNSGEGLWGSSEEVPSFLYAMPLGGNRCSVLLETTWCSLSVAVPAIVVAGVLLYAMPLGGNRCVTRKQIHFCSSLSLVAVPAHAVLWSLGCCTLPSATHHTQPACMLAKQAMYCDILLWHAACFCNNNKLTDNPFTI